MTALASQIEIYLLTQQNWVSGEELCREFEVRERELRCHGDEPGLISDFTISHSRKGYRHVRNATSMEWLAFKFSLLRHAISEIRRVKRLSKARHNVITGKPPVEKFSGQGILL